MCFKQNRRFKSNHTQHDYKNKWIKKICHANVNVNLIVEHVIQIKSGITINVGASVKIKKKHSVCKKRLYWSPGICCCKNSKYLASIISDSVITCDEIVEETKTVPTSFNEKMEPVKQVNCYFASLFY